MLSMDPELWSNIRRLRLAERLSQAAIARRLGVHRDTVKRALAAHDGPPKNGFSRGNVPSKLDPFKPHIQDRLAQFPELPGSILLQEIKVQGYTGGRAILGDYLCKVRPAPPKAFLRLETLPGEYAQVDWAHIGMITIGNRAWRLSCFVMVLSYSRMLYLEFTLSQSLEAFLAAHVHAFDFFGGVPKKINYDNLKTVVLSRAGRDIRFHPRFMTFTGHYLFEPVPCNVRAAWEKGKVESAVKFVRSGFLAGRAVTTLPLLNDQARAWRDGQANVRIHGTTHERPVDRFVLEKERLQPLPALPYDTSVVKPVGVDRQALVRFDANRYSVPAAYAGKSLTLKAGPHRVELFDGPGLVASHGRCYERHRVYEDPAHLKDILLARKKARAARAHNDFLALAPECRDYLTGLVAAELDLHAHLDKIMDLVHLYGKTEVAGAVAHALRFRAFGASYIQRVIQQRRAARDMPEPTPIILTKKPDWNRLAVEQTDLSVYDDLYEDPS
jgi:transposase